jgi:hypothetical protein
MRILEEAFHEIENGVRLVLGGPNCKKATTISHAVPILNLVGHKILAVAEENLCLDNFIVKLEEARRELLDALRVARFFEWASLVRSICDSSLQR